MNTLGDDHTKMKEDKKKKGQVAYDITNEQDLKVNTKQLIYTRNSLTILENKPLVTKGDGGAERGIPCGVKMNLYTVTYTQNTINRPTVEHRELYSTL